MSRSTIQSTAAILPDYQPLVVVVAAAAVGIVCDRYGALGGGAWWLSAAGLWCLWWAIFRAQHVAAGGILLLCVAATGAAWHHACWSIFSWHDLGAFGAETAQPICLEAVVMRGPRRTPAPEFDPLRPVTTADRTRLKLTVTGVRNADRWEPAAGLATLDVNGHLLGVEAGDRLQVFASLRAPRGPMNPGEFDFAEHLRADRQLCQMSADHPECVTRLAAGAWWKPARWLDRARRAGDNALWTNLGRGQSGLALALVLGEREELDLTTTRQFYETGTVHLLSISGLHVGLLALALFWGMRLGFWRRGPALAAVAIITAAYALVIDAEPPAVRATVMVWLLCAALYSGRPMSPLNVLAAAALLVLVWNPAELFRVGTQLSFLAVGTIIWVGPQLASKYRVDPLTRLIARTRPWPVRTARQGARSVGNLMVLSLVVWLVSAPLVLARFHLLSPATLILTPLLAIPIGMGLLLGFALVSIGWLVWPLSIPLGWACDACMALVRTGMATFDGPAGHFWLPGPSWWWLAVLYLVLGLWAADARLRPPRRWCTALVAGWTAVGLFAAQWGQLPRGELKCTFLSVGHGCAAVLELPDGKTMLYDAGQLGSPTAAARSISSFLWSRGKTHIDAIVLSHADVDHFNAVPELLRRFSVGIVYVSPVMFDVESAAIQTLRQAVERTGVPLGEISAGERLHTAGDCTIEVLHPPRRGTLGSDNSNSVVLEVSYQGRHLLLPGDLESPGLDELLAENPRDYDVVLAPHHGSLRSDPPGFAAWSTPEWVVISGDSRSNRDEVARAYRDAGAAVLNTSARGAIGVTVSPAEFHVAAWRTSESRAADLVVDEFDEPDPPE